MLKERLENLLKTVTNEEDLQIIDDSLEHIVKFSSVNAKIDADLRFLRLKNLEPEDFIEERERLLMSQYYNNKAAIISIRILNRLCNLYKIEKVYLGEDTEEEILRFVEELNKEFFGISYVG